MGEIHPHHAGRQQRHAVRGARCAVRGAAALRQCEWPMRKPWRRLSYAIDTLLLAAGVSLWLLLRLNPVHDAWLGAKLLLLIAYIVAGSLALKYARLPASRWISYGCALGLYLFIASVAVTHEPLGCFARFR